MNQQNQKSIDICILFDSDSQKMYVIESLRDKLNLKRIKQERLQLNTFGDRNFSTHHCDIVHIFYRSLDQAIQLESVPCVSQ